MKDRRPIRVRAGRLRRSLRPLGLGVGTAADRVATAIRSIGNNVTDKQTRRREFHERTASRYAQALGDMKGAWMKLGQILSFVDVDAIPAQYRGVYQQALGSLLAEAPPMDATVLDEVVRVELGRPSNKTFSWFCSEPLAAASIGQVHEARLPDGTAVAVKIQYPGVAEAIDDDLKNTELLATFIGMSQGLLGRLAPRTDPRTIAAELRERVSEELDYTLEARNQEHFRKIYDGHPFIRVPKVFSDYSTSRVITMELAEGRRWPEALQAPDELRQRWAEIIFRFAIGSVDRFSVFNGDPHPGNYLFNDDGSVTFLDFGSVKFMPPQMMRAGIAMMRALVEGRPEDLKRLFVETGFLLADDPTDPKRIHEWFSGLGGQLFERPYTFTHEKVGASIRRTYDPLGEWGDVIRRFKMPKDNLLLTRIDLGLWSILASLSATNDWRGISEEIWGVGPPAGLLGQAEAQWLAGHSRRENWPPPHPERTRHEAPAAVFDFDPQEKDFQVDPYPYYERLRSQGAIHWVPPGVWLVPRYEDCASLLNDPRLSSDPTSSQLYQEFVLGVWGRESAVDRVARSLLLFMDPPDHTRMRSLVQAAFTRRAVEELRPRITNIAEELLSRVDGKLDLVADFAYPLPITVIAEVLGVPLGDREEFSRWSRDLVQIFSVDTPTPEVIDGSNATVETFLDYFRALSDERRRSPKEDLLSALITAEDSGHRLNENELLSTCTLLLVAGHETTANLIANGTLALLRNPKELRNLRETPSLIGGAVDELLRYDSPVQATARTTLAEIEIAGRTIPAGQRLALLLGSANRDPDRFSEPDRLMFDRAPNHHLSFGSGIHFCLGAPLARIEARIAISSFLDRFPSIELGADTLRWREIFPIRSLQELPLEVSLL